jgi:5-enolpyruvylshikimate-3-phosphate synthase
MQGNSGTLARLIMGLLVHTKKKLKLLVIKVYQKEIF